MVRYKYRYALCKVVNENRAGPYTFADADIYSAIRREVVALHGDYAVASMRIASFLVRYLDKDSGIVLIKCKRGVHKLLLSALPFITKIGKEKAFLHTIHVGGTVRSCLKFLIRYHKSRLPQLLMQCKTKEEKLKVQKAIVNSCQETTDTIMYIDKSVKPNDVTTV